MPGKSLGKKFPAYQSVPFQTLFIYRYEQRISGRYLLVIQLLKGAVAWCAMTGVWLIAYLIGNLRFGYSWRAGKRLVIFILGAAVTAVGIVLVYFGVNSEGRLWPVMVGFLLGGTVISGGLAFLVCGVFGRNDTIDAWFEDMWNGI